MGKEINNVDEMLNQTEPFRKIVLWVVLGGICCVLMWGSVRLFSPKEPFVDLSKRAPSVSHPAVSTGTDKELRFAVATMWSVKSTFSMYGRLVERICRDVGREKTFVLRPSYVALRRAMEQGQVDVALVCTGPYICARPTVKLLVQPEFADEVQYRSILIVPSRSPAQSLKDLRNMVMGFSDPESFTGCLVPCMMLAEEGRNPKSFFKKVVFTGSHDRSIQAVERGIVDGSAVHSIVLASAKREDPSLTNRIKEIWKSEIFGPPPVVVPRNIDKNLRNSLREAFLALDDDEEGREILSTIDIVRFVPTNEKNYRTAGKLYERLKTHTEVTKWLWSGGH